MILYVTRGILYTVYLLTDAIDEAVNVDELKHNVCVLVNQNEGLKLPVPHSDPLLVRPHLYSLAEMI